MKITLILILVGLVLWTLWSIYISRAEQMTYTVLEKRNGYEIRQYDPYIAATVEVDQGGRTGSNQAFRILAGYIFGNNIAEQSVAMTAPVITQENTSAPIAMTAPVMANEEDKKTTMTFSMPKKYTLTTLPKPLDTRISVSEVPAKKFAALTFRWWYSESRVEKKKQELMDILKKENIKTLGEPIFAGYNGPGTIPFLIHSDILLEIQ